MAAYLQAANVSLSVAQVGAPDCPLVYVNDRFTALTGYDFHDVVGHNCRLLQGHLTYQPGVEDVRKFMRDPSIRRVRARLINFRADGSPFINQLTMHRVVGPGGTPRFYLASQFDITAAAPDQLLEYDEELAEAFRMKAVSRDQREIMIGSIQSMGEAAAAITQAKYLMDEAERAGMLGL